MAQTRKRWRDRADLQQPGCTSAWLVLVPPQLHCQNWELEVLNVKGDTDMRTIVIAAIAVALATPAYAQGAKPMYGDSKKPGEKTAEETARERQQEKLEEKASNKALSRVPDRPQKVDPWGNIR